MTTDVELPDVLAKHFERKVAQIGAGAFGKVYLAVHKMTQEKVAIKILNKESLDRDLHRAYTEVKVLHLLTHQNVVELYSVYEDDSDLYIIMEHLSGGELFDHIVTKQRLMEDEARIIFRQILAAVAYMHAKNIVHRDLKPENVMFDDLMNVKIVDFGLSANPLGGISSTLETNCGSLAYAAPELLAGKYKGSEADVWTLGILLYVLLCGCLPFEKESPEETIKLIKAGEFMMPDDISAEAQDILNNMICVDPLYRITLWQLLAHDWLCIGFGSPVDWLSKVQSDFVDQDILNSIASYYNLQKKEVSDMIDERVHSMVTCHYKLAIKRKSKILSESYVDASVLKSNNLNEKIYTKNNAESVNPRDKLGASFGKEPNVSLKHPDPHAANIAEKTIRTPMKHIDECKDIRKRRELRRKAGLACDSPPAQKNFKFLSTPYKTADIFCDASFNFVNQENNCNLQDSLNETCQCDQNLRDLNKSSSLIEKCSGKCKANKTANIAEKSTIYKKSKIWDSADTIPSKNCDSSPKNGNGNSSNKKNLLGRLVEMFSFRKKSSDTDKLVYKNKGNIIWTCYDSCNSLKNALSETFYVLTKNNYIQQFEMKENNFRCKFKYKSHKSVTLELEIIHNKKYGVGLRRKRIHGDSWSYTLLCKKIFQMTYIET